MNHRIAIFIGVSVILAVVTGCFTSTSLEKRQVVVVDSARRPISGISVFPQPIVAGSKQSDQNGRLWVYVLDPTRKFQLSGLGYHTKSFDFDQQEEYCVLQAIR